MRFFYISFLLTLNLQAAPLIGVHFGNNGSAPLNWNLVDSAPEFASSTNLIDETGAITGVNLSNSTTGTLAFFTVVAPNAATLPSHTTSLASLAGNTYDSAFSTGLLTSTFSGLTANAAYNVWVVGIRGGATALGQAITITGSGAPIALAQNAAANNYVVNGLLGSSANSFASYAIQVMSSATGTITIDTQAAGATTYTVSALAIQSVDAPELDGAQAVPPLLWTVALLLAGVSRRSRIKPQDILV